MLNLRFPDNAYVMSVILNKVANFNVFHLEKYNRMIFEFDKDSKATNKRFRDYSFKTSNFIINSEILFYTLLIYIVLALIFFILSRIICEDSYIGRGILAIKEKFFFNFLVRLMLEGYLEFFLCSIVNLQ